MKQAYPTFIAAAGTDFLVYVPDLDIYTEGKSVADAIAMARDAIGMKVMALQDSKQTVPEPTNYEGALAKAKADADDFDYSAGMLTMVDVDFHEYRKKHDNKMVRKNVTIPNWLNVAAEEAHLNVSRVLQEALKERLSF